MLENLFCAAVALLSAWGALALAYTLLFSVIRPKKNERSVLLLLPGPDSDSVEQVSLALSRLSVTGELRYTCIAVLVAPEETETRKALLAAFGLGTMTWTKVLLPIGISFFSFQSVTYVVDVCRGINKPMERLTDYVVYIIMFPQLIAGPIVRYTDIADQIATQ